MVLRKRTDDGYALIVALMAAAAFAYLAFQILAANAGAVADAAGRRSRAELTAAADAGIAIAAHGLAREDPEARWAADGQPRRLDFNGVDLTVTVGDESAKAPLAGLDDAQSRTLFEGAGASGARLDALVGEFADWRDRAQAVPGGSDEDRAHRFRALGELMALPDMDRDLYARITPSVTVFFQPGARFDPDGATPLAVATMQAAGAHRAGSQGAPAAFAGERPVLDTALDDHLAGRALLVTATARDDRGGRATRMAVIEFSGVAGEPVWVRYAEDQP